MPTGDYLALSQAGRKPQNSVPGDGEWRLLGRLIADLDLSRADIATGWYLLDLMDDETTRRPSYRIIAQNTGQSARNAKRSVERLVAKGYLPARAGGRR